MSSIVDNPRGGCVLGGLNSALGAIKGICPIFHSGPGCCMQSSAAQQSMSGGKSIASFTGNAIPCSNMQEKDVVFGGAKKLEGTIKGALEVIEADAYFVVIGCAGGIIGDDVPGVAEEFHRKGYPVYAVDSPGFIGNSTQGYDEAWNALIDNLVKDHEKDSNLVNIFGIIPYQDPFWSGNLEEIARILRRLGLKVNTFYTDNQDITNVEQSSAAALNIIIHPWLFEKNAKKYKDLYGIDYVRFDALPIGPSETTAFVQKIGEVLNIDDTLVKEVIESEEQYVYGYFEQIIASKSWERYGLVADSSTAIGLNRFLANDFSYSPKYVIVYDSELKDEYKTAIEERLTKLDYARPPKVYFAHNQFDIDRIVKSNPDISLLIGSALEKDVAYDSRATFIEMTFPVTGRRFLNRAIAGYRGSLSLVEDLYDNL